MEILDRLLHHLVRSQLGRYGRKKDGTVRDGTLATEVVLPNPYYFLCFFHNQIDRNPGEKVDKDKIHPKVIGRNGHKTVSWIGSSLGGVKVDRSSRTVSLRLCRSIRFIRSIAMLEFETGVSRDG